MPDESGILLWRGLTKSPRLRKSGMGGFVSPPDFVSRVWGGSSLLLYNASPITYKSDGAALTRYLHMSAAGSKLSPRGCRGVIV